MSAPNLHPPRTRRRTAWTRLGAEAFCVAAIVIAGASATATTTDDADDAAIDTALDSTSLSTTSDERDQKLDLDEVGGTLAPLFDGELVGDSGFPETLTFEEDETVEDGIAASYSATLSTALEGIRVSIVPEPGSALLIGLGLVGISCARKQRIATVGTSAPHRR